jgi:Ca2+-transporting ATPase
VRPISPSSPASITINRRDGHQVHLLANELVPGDIVTFQVSESRLILSHPKLEPRILGDRIPADIRILTSLDLEIDESSLTGETRPARKSVAPCAPRAPLGERNSIAFMGTCSQREAPRLIPCSI